METDLDQNIQQLIDKLEQFEQQKRKFINSKNTERFVDDKEGNEGCSSEVEDAAERQGSP